MPNNTSRLIRAKIDQYVADPASLANNVKRLRDEAGVVRLRVGDGRVLIDEDERIVAIIRIGPRSGIYDQTRTVVGKSCPS